MADRVVVMNHGVIEQCGTPAEVYEQPATPFVATFLGRVNILPGQSLGAGRFKVGDVDLVLPVDGFAAGKLVRIYVRPEDRHVEGDIAALPNRLSGRIGRIDYLGTFCLAQVGCDGLQQPITLSFSLNQLHDLGVREGGRLDFALRPDRVRVFADASP